MAVLDHLVYAAADLLDAVEDLESRLGVMAAAGGQHVGLGTHNALLGLGDGAYLEIIAPDPLQQRHTGPRPFGILDTQPAGLVGWAVRSADLDADVEALRAIDHDPGETVFMSRTRPDGVELQWRLTAGAGVGGVVPFLIDWGISEHPSTSAPAGLTVEAVEVTHPEPDRVRGVYEALGLDVRIVPGREPSLAAVVRGPQGVVRLD